MAHFLDWISPDAWPYLNTLKVLFVMIGLHALCDFPWQGQYLSDTKAKGPFPRYHCLMHSWIHGVAVYAVTGLFVLGVLEVVVHYITDRAKVKNEIDYWTDQAMHLVAKLAWACVASLYYIGLLWR